VAHIRVQEWPEPGLLHRLREEVVLASERKLSGTGFRLEDFEITEAGDTLAAEAQETVVRGRAEAVVAHELSLKTQPVRGDLPHALAFIAAVLGRIFERSAGRP
jgi:hypothetical protein